MPTIRENLLLLQELVKKQPDKLFSLEAYQRPTECGTLFCTLGLAANHPTFQSMGFGWGVADFSENPVVKLNGFDAIDEPKLDEIFGRRAFDRLFTASFNDVDEEEKSDKRNALARIDKQLEQYP